jgi:hypothetical protein
MYEKQSGIFWPGWSRRGRMRKLNKYAMARNLNRSSDENSCRIKKMKPGI